MAHSYISNGSEYQHFCKKCGLERNTILIVGTQNKLYTYFERYTHYGQKFIFAEPDCEERIIKQALE